MARGLLGTGKLNFADACRLMVYHLSETELKTVRHISLLAKSGSISPERTFNIAGRLVVWFAVVATVLCLAGTMTGLFLAPTDAEQSEIYRIVYIHVPAAWTSLVVALAVPMLVVAGAVRNARLPLQVADAVIPTGVMLSFLALWTGCLWAKHIWGTWWVWDAPLVSELLLLVLYSGMIVVRTVAEDDPWADRLVAVLALCGGVVAIAIHFSVESWHTLHHGATVGPADPIGLESTMLLGVGATALGMCAYVGAVTAARLRCAILEAERNSLWVARYHRACR